MTEMSVPKTYKMFIKGAFVRSESGRVAPVERNEGEIRRVASGSRKDLRDAVVAARGAQGAWRDSTPYLKGQILYRIAEMMDGRRDELVDELSWSGLGDQDARDDVTDALDTWLWWAGWTDKLTSVLGTVNPVAGPFLNVSTPEPTGVVGAFPRGARPLTGLAELLGPILCGGNTVVAVVDHRSAPPAASFAEVLATSDVPGGVVNILTSDVASLVGWMADHGDVDALDVSGLDDDQRREATVRSASNLKRVSSVAGDRSPLAAAHFLELKTVWHPARL